MINPYCVDNLPCPCIAHQPKHLLWDVETAQRPVQCGQFTRLAFTAGELGLAMLPPSLPNDFKLKEVEAVQRGGNRKGRVESVQSTGSVQCSVSDCLVE